MHTHTASFTRSGAISPSLMVEREYRQCNRPAPRPVVGFHRATEQFPHAADLFVLQVLWAKITHHWYLAENFAELEELDPVDQAYWKGEKEKEQAIVDELLTVGSAG